MKLFAWAAAIAVLSIAAPAGAAEAEGRPRIALIAAVEPFSRGSVAAVLVNVGRAWSLEPRARFSQETTEGPGASASGPGLSITSTRRLTYTEWGGGLAVLRFFRPRDGTSSYAGAAVRLTQIQVAVRQRFHGGPGRPRDSSDSVSRYKASAAAVAGVQHYLASRSSARSASAGQAATPVSCAASRTTTRNGGWSMPA